MTLFIHPSPFGSTSDRTRISYLRYASGVCAAAAMFLGLSAGCGGSGNASGQAHIRSYNLCSNGESATIFINNGATNGTENFGQASGYLFLNGGMSSFTFTLSAQPDNGYPSINKSLTGGDYYTVFLIGNANVVTEAQKGYPFLTLEQDDRTAPASGNARVRIVHAAPDGGAVDVKVAGQTVATDFIYGTIGVGASSTAPTVGGPTGTYVDVPAGSTTVTVDATGTNTPLFATPLPVSLAAGHLYTISVVEPTVAVAAVTGPPATAAIPAVYGATIVDDGT